MCKSARNFDQGRIDSKLTSMIKMVAGSCAPEVCDEAAQLPGGTGYMLVYGGEMLCP
ncbi:MAG: acyl-CoA dehydrogenase family protein [Desulfobacterales bacterium]